MVKDGDSGVASLKTLSIGSSAETSAASAVIRILISKPLPPPLRLMPFDKSDRRGKETKFLTHAILEMTHERKMQARLSTRGENDERRRTNANLRDVLHMQARPAMRPGRHDA